MSLPDDARKAWYEDAKEIRGSIHRESIFLLTTAVLILILASAPALTTDSVPGFPFVINYPIAIVWGPLFLSALSIYHICRLREGMKSPRWTSRAPKY